jgi:hypothetical protein
MSVNIPVPSFQTARSEKEMCKCTPGIRTPYCGKPGCEWPKQVNDPNAEGETMGISTGKMYLKESAQRGQILEFKYDEITIRNGQVKYRRNEIGDIGQYDYSPSKTVSSEELICQEEAKKIARVSLEKQLAELGKK